MRMWLGWFVVGCAGCEPSQVVIDAPAPTATTTVESTGSETSGPSTGTDSGVRPGNPSCFAPARPSSDAEIELTRVFEQLSFRSPVALVAGIGAENRWYVVQQTGQLHVFEAEESVEQSSVALDLSATVEVTSEAGLLDVAFHPDFNANGQLFVSYNTRLGGQLVSRISRFVSIDGGASFSTASEQVLLELDQPWSNHNGGRVAFGPDGYLYIGLGDGGSGGDPLGSGQDTDTLLGAILRIDPDGADPYAIPPDNPFADGSGAEEIYAWGLRNPWRFTFDRETGALWAGDVGQIAWEEVSLIERGGNYGWNLKEGDHCYAVSPCDFGWLQDPVVEYPNTGYASVVMGPVYQGEAIPALKGAPIFSDFYEGTIWRISWDPISGEPERTELARSTGRAFSGYGQDAAGEVYAIDYSTGGIYRLDPASAQTDSDFPELLSETGCMDPADPSQPVVGLIAYDVNHPLWSDEAEKERWFAIPDNTQITVDAAGDWELPLGSVVVKHFRLAGRLLETRLMVRHEDGEWAGYTYAWDSTGSDARYAPSGTRIELDEGTWTTPSSADCLGCHTAAAGRTLGLETAQLNRETPDATGSASNQLVRLSAMGLFETPLASSAEEASQLDALPPLDSGLPAAEIARAYLHVNCGNCHQPDGLGGGSGDFRYSTPSAALGVCDAEPEYGDMGVDGALQLVPGDADHSLISLRMGVRDVHAMPPIGSAAVDKQGKAIVDAWIDGLSACPDN